MTATEIRPIRNEADYDAALEEIERLMDARPGTPDCDRLEVLATLVTAYEQEHHPVPPPDPIDALAYFMESRGITRRDLEPCIGSRGRVAEVLNRRRPLTLEMIRRLHERFGFQTDTLIGRYQLPLPSRP